MIYRKITKITEVYNDIQERASDKVLKKLSGYELTEEGFNSFDFNETEEHSGFISGKIYPYAVYEKNT